MTSCSVPLRVISTGVPAAYLSALVRRFVITCSIRSRSQCPSRTPSERKVTVDPARVACSRKRSTTS